MEVGALDVQGLPLLAQPAPRQSYAPMAGKRMPFSHEPPLQWSKAPVTLINQWKGGGDGGKRMIQRLNEESGCQEHIVLSTWRWWKQGWLGMSQTTDRWPRPQSSLFTFKPQYLNTNSPNWSLYISLKNELREFDKRSKYFFSLRWSFY